MARRRVARSCAVYLAVAALCLGLGFGWLRHRRTTREWMRERDLPVTVRNADPLIAAIERYTRERHKPPSSLDALVPEYLPRLPAPGPAAERGWIYHADAGAKAGGWSLSVDVRDEYSPSLLTFGDTFVYSPTGQHPSHVARVGKWGYYVE